jgi:hypothetical protein
MSITAALSEWDVEPLEDGVPGNNGFWETLYVKQSEIKTARRERLLNEVESRQMRRPDL